MFLANHRWVSAVLLGLVMCVLGAASTLFAQEEAMLRPIPCPMALPIGEVEGETVVCGVLHVPERYDADNGRRIELTYAILRTPNLSPARDPILYLHGGPGSAELSQLPQLAERFAAFRRTRDVIVLDQRGAGLSSGALDCASVLAANPQMMVEAIQSSASAGRELTDGIEDLCIDSVTARDVDLSQYNTINNARDVHRLIDGLLAAPDTDYNAVNLYAWSYGTALALETVRQDESAIRSVILDGTLSMTIKWGERQAEARVEAALILFAACAADPACAAAFPDLQAQFNTAAERLTDAPIELPSGDVVDVAALVNLITLRNNVTADRRLTAYLPQIISELAQGDATTYAAWSNGELDAVEPPEPAASPSIADQPGLVRAAAEAAQQAADADGQATTAIARLQHMLAQLQQTPSLAQQFDHAVAVLVAESGDAALNNALAGLPLGPSTAAALLDLLAENNVDTESQIAQIAAQMTDADVAALRRIVLVRNQTQGLGQLAATVVPNRVFQCNDRYPASTAEGEAAFMAGVPLPAMLAGTEIVERERERCAQYGLSGNPPATLYAPVASDLPVLVLSGDFDTQTAPSWGEIARATLPNSIGVRFPASGHGVIRFSQCAKDVAAAFVNDPGAVPVSSCTQDLVIPFVIEQAVDE